MKFFRLQLKFNINYTFEYSEKENNNISKNGTQKLKIWNWSKEFNTTPTIQSLRRKINYKIPQPISCFKTKVRNKEEN